MRSRRLRGKLALLAVAAALIAVWLVLLPAIAGLHAEEVRRLIHAGVDPGAFFYTDHLRMRDVVD